MISSLAYWYCDVNIVTSRYDSICE